MTTVILTIGPSCAHGDDVIGGNISERQNDTRLKTPMQIKKKIQNVEIFILFTVLDLKFNKLFIWSI